MTTLINFEWKPVSHERYNWSLNCLPPAAERRSMFLVGEAYDHFSDDGSPRFRDDGSPRFRVFRKVAGECSEGTRPITVAEFYSLP